MKKEVVFDERALKDYWKLDSSIRKVFSSLFITLEQEGKLDEPEAKKLDQNLYEIRVRLDTA
jgi:mRNA-degrading endonuclease RelE of RelBE toxin-antitoxin system